MSALSGSACVSAAELEQPAVAELLAGERLRSVSVDSRLLLAAARMALRDARARTGGPREDATGDALGVVVATRHAGLQDYVELYREGTDAERPRVRPAKGPQAGLTAPAAEVSIRLPAAGPNATVCNGAVGGLDALRYAADRLAAGEVDAMLVCELDLAPAVVREAGEDAQRAAVLVLEREQAVHARGAAPYAWLGEVTTTFDPDADATRTREQDEAGPIARLAVAFAHDEAPIPQLLVAHESGAAGAAVIQPEPAGRR
ncbi:MAG: beta-ketoacyl synthase N-terminal-like domain-containing protein [Conexibacter sp.]